MPSGATGSMGFLRSATGGLLLCHIRISAVQGQIAPCHGRCGIDSPQGQKRGRNVRQPAVGHRFYRAVSLLLASGIALPRAIGMVSGLFFGFAFGMGGLGAAVLGLIADHTSIFLVYKICAFLPLLGMLTIFLPDNRHKA